MICGRHCHNGLDNLVSLWEFVFLPSFSVRCIDSNFWSSLRRSIAGVYLLPVVSFSFLIFKSMYFSISDLFFYFHVYNHTDLSLPVNIYCVSLHEGLFLKCIYYLQMLRFCFVFKCVITLIFSSTP